MIICAFLLVLYAVSADAAKEGDYCTKAGIAGVCTNIRQCPDALQDIRDRKEPKLCEFQGIDPTVCCTSVVTTTTARPQTGKCVLPPYPDHGKYATNVRNGKPGDAHDIFVVNVTCHRGYELNGTRNIFCQDGWWPEPMPICAHICQLPMLAGPCDESVMRWFYDATSDSCSQFTYGGCEGNDNRFETSEECENRCKSGPAPSASTTTTTAKVEESLPSDCAISLELEQCSPEAAGEVWYYDRDASSACKAHQNLDSGADCRTSGVFYSQEACERSCGVFRGIDVCQYGVEPGPCRNYRPKYFYNKNESRCQEFAYGGCFGGANRFSSEQECEHVCMTNVGTEGPASREPAEAPVQWHQYEYRLYRTIELGCHPGGAAISPSFVYAWKVNSTSVGNVAGLAGRYALMEGGSVLKVARADEADWGNYTCFVDGTPVRGYHVNARPVLRLPADVTVVEGQQLKLTCRVLGKPYPAVWWTYSKAAGENATDVLKVMGDRVELRASETGVEGGELVIKAAARTDAGLFTCRATTSAAGYWAPTATTILRIYMIDM